MVVTWFLPCADSALLSVELAPGDEACRVSQRVFECGREGRVDDRGSDAVLVEDTSAQVRIDNGNRLERSVTGIHRGEA